MTARRPVHSSIKPATTNRLFESSTADWYAQWKARQTADNSKAPSTTEPPKDEPADALAQWLTGNVER